MHLINLIVIYLYRKYVVPTQIFFEKWTRGTNHLKANGIFKHFLRSFRLSFFVAEFNAKSVKYWTKEM